MRDLFRRLSMSFGGKLWLCLLVVLGLLSSGASLTGCRGDRDKRVKYSHVAPQAEDDDDDNDD